MYNTQCIHFTGYKPCKFKRSCIDCPRAQRAETRVVIVSLEALGAVLRSTCLLSPIKRRYQNSHVTWITMPNAVALLKNNSQINQILPFDATLSSILGSLEFDVAFIVDKSIAAGALANQINAAHKFGFGINSAGKIIPLTESASYQYSLGLDDQLKFFENQKPETQQITETMGLDWERDSYHLEFSPEEMQEIDRRRRQIKAGFDGVIGFSTGCSTLFPYKKFTVEKSIEIIEGWLRDFPKYKIALFGGREDTDRNRAIKGHFIDVDRVENTPTSEGLRSGILWMAVADLILTGCSLGLHISIALETKIITWFGVSCAQEIDLYERGLKLSSNVPCSPCWKKSCDKDVKCFDEVSNAEILSATSTLLLGSSK